MAEEIRNKFVSWTLNVVKEIKEIPAKNGGHPGGGGHGGFCGVGIGLALVQPPPPPAAASSSSSSSSPATNNNGNNSAAAAGCYNRVGVESVEPSGPAARVGLRAGDAIAEVDGRRFDDGKAYLPDDVAAAIRGPEGSEVGVVVERDGERVEFTLTRAPIGISPPTSPARRQQRERQQPPKEQQQQKEQQKQKQKQKQSSEKKTKKKGTKGEDKAKKDDTHREGKNESENEVAAAGAGESAASTVADSLESLALSDEGQKEKDLASSTETADTDQFDNSEAPRPAHRRGSGARPPGASFLPAHHGSSSSSNEVSEEKTVDVDDEEISSIGGDADSQWEMISERSGSAVLISLSGSISGASTSFRSASPSVLKNKFVLAESTGEPYIEHVVLPTDTLQGLCLAYKLSATRLRMENGFSGNSLQMAPKRLRIPTNAPTKGMMIRTQDKTSREFKLYAFVAKLPSMELVEAKAYLDLSNWDLDEAIRSAREDEGWSPNSGFDESSSPVESPLPIMDAMAKPKALTAKDIYAAAPSFDGEGFELKDIKRS